MKYVVKIIGCFLLFILLGCAMQQTSITINCNKFTEDAVFVDVSNDNKIKVIYKQVVERVLFVGLNQSNICPTISPLINSSSIDEDKMKRLEQELFKSGRYLDFITGEGSDGEGNIIKCVVRREALRNWLVVHSYINNLSNGF